jgi:Family of unknown function (DUF5677)
VRTGCWGNNIENVATRISFIGFFSDQALEISKAIQHEQKQLFFYLSEVNEKSHQYRGLWQVNSTDLKQLFAAALFQRALTSYQALILLIQKGFASEARATCRNILEAKFRLAYLCNEPEAAVLLIALGEKRRAARLRDMKEGALPVAESLKNRDWNSVIAKAEAPLKDPRVVKKQLPRTAKQIAGRSGLMQDYLGWYSYLSEATHSGHIEINSYLEFNRDGTGVKTVLYGLEDGNWVDLVALQGAAFMIDCMEYSGHILRLRSQRLFDSLLKSLLKRNNDIMQRFRAMFIEEAEAKQQTEERR